jgi:hypothetical protein
VLHQHPALSIDRSEMKWHPGGDIVSQLDRSGRLISCSSKGQFWSLLVALPNGDTYWIREDGTIGKVENRLFKGELELCAGLPIRYGDDVQEKLLAWERTVPVNAYRDCEVVFNYSPNGNVLDSIASIANRRSFIVVDGRAVTASVWE